MSRTFIPEGYKSAMTLYETQKAIEETRRLQDGQKLQSDLKQLWEKGVSWKAVKVGLENLGDHSRQTVFLRLCDTIKKQSAERTLKATPVRGAVSKDYNAALWAVKNGLV